MGFGEGKTGRFNPWYSTSWINKEGPVSGRKFLEHKGWAFNARTKKRPPRSGRLVRTGNTTQLHLDILKTQRDIWTGRAVQYRGKWLLILLSYKKLGPPTAAPFELFPVVKGVMFRGRSNAFETHYPN